MKKISWITPECFIDVDVPVISRLQSYYKIRLILVIPQNGIDYKNYVNGFLGESENVEVIYVYQNSKLRLPINILLYNRIINLAKAFMPNLYYISFMGIPYALPLYKLRLPIKKCIVPCHNVSTPKGANSERIADFYKDMWLRTFSNIQVFSEGQLNILKSTYSNKTVLLAYLMLKDYGKPRKVKRQPDGVVRFLFFGNIVKYKRLDLLLEAVNTLVERSERRFILTIAGSCNNWNEYKRYIKYPEQINVRIERIPNEEVADLFSENHYLVMPYQDIAQSGAITVAFRYNVPTIVSDIPQFKEFVVDGQTALTFKSENAKSLSDVLEYVINNHQNIYDKFRKNQEKMVEDKFADEAIVKKYKAYFDSLM